MKSVEVFFLLFFSFIPWFGSFLYHKSFVIKVNIGSVVIYTYLIY